MIEKTYADAHTQPADFMELLLKWLQVCVTDCVCGACQFTQHAPCIRLSLRFTPPLPNDIIMAPLAPPSHCLHGVAVWLSVNICLAPLSSKHQVRSSWPSLDNFNNSLFLAVTSSYCAEKRNCCKFPGCHTAPLLLKWQSPSQKKENWPINSSMFLFVISCFIFVCVFSSSGLGWCVFKTAILLLSKIITVSIISLLKPLGSTAFCFGFSSAALAFTKLSLCMIGSF